MEIAHAPAADGPSSPGIKAVGLAEASADLLRFVLTSRIAGDADFADLPLRPNYCARLLAVDDDDEDPQNPRGRGGVPRYPLCEKLAEELVRCIEAEEFPGSEAAMVVSAEEMWEAREAEWKELILRQGLHLSKLYDAVEFELHVQEPFFSQLKAASKKVEGRCAVGNYNKISQGSLLLFNKCLMLNVEKVTKYSSFYEMLQTEGLANVLPGVATIEEGLQIYRKFYTEEKEKSNGVLAISVSKPSSQPYAIMKEILSGLGYDGVGWLLGMAHTSGSVLDELPPPRSILMKSSCKRHRPDEQ